MIWLLGGYMWLFVHRPFEVWPSLGDLQVERVYMLLMVAYWAVQPNKGWAPNRIHAALAVFTLVVTAAWVASPYMGAPGCLDTVENYYKVIVFYVLVVSSVRDEGALRKLVLMFLASVALYMSHSLLEYAAGRCQWRMGIRRMIGVDETFMDPNAFAAGLVCALPLTLPFWAGKSSPRMRVLLAGFAALACLCILLTGSRAGLMGLGLCALLCLFASGRIKTAMLSLALLAAAAPVAWAALPEELQMRYLTIIDPSYGPPNAQQSVEGRLDGLVLGYEVWARSPLLGEGPGAFMAATGSVIKAHNVYGQVISELGTLGALALAGLIVCYLLNWLEARRSQRRRPDLPRDFAYYVSLAMALEVILLLFLGCAGHNLFRYQWVWFAAFQAVALHCVRKRAALADERAAGWQAAAGMGTAAVDFA